MILNGHIREGLIVLPESETERKDRWASRKSEMTPVRIEITVPERARSKQQNAYYHGCVVEPISAHIGLDTDTTHEVLKDQHLSESVRMSFDRRRKIKIVKSTRDLNTVEFEAYLDRIRKWSLKFLKFRVALPNEVPLYAYDTKNPQ